MWAKICHWESLRVFENVSKFLSFFSQNLSGCNQDNLEKRNWNFSMIIFANDFDKTWEFWQNLSEKLGPAWSKKLVSLKCWRILVCCNLWRFPAGEGGWMVDSWGVSRVSPWCCYGSMHQPLPKFETFSICRQICLLSRDICFDVSLYMSVLPGVISDYFSFTMYSGHFVVSIRFHLRLRGLFKDSKILWRVPLFNACNF